MKKEGYYSSGEFAKLAHVSLRTVRYYDKRNILTPSFVSEAGARFYTDDDLAKLQQILLFKYLGFSLDEIKELTIGDVDDGLIANSLNMQLKLVKDRIEQMQLVEQAIEDTTKAIASKSEPDWNQIFEAIQKTGMETSMKKQYQDASNITARIQLHALYSQNEERWFPWVYRQMEEHYDLKNSAQILELGCGNGSLWIENRDRLPENISVVVSDKSEGMIRDARRAIGAKHPQFRFEKIDCEQIPYEDNCFDIVVANHVMFYCDNIDKALSEIKRVLRPDGVFICTTYGSAHMKEISQLVQAFDNRIVLAAENLYERFGLENGTGILKEFFVNVDCQRYEDSLEVTNVEHLVDYIISCHGNQARFLLDRYKDFKGFLESKKHQAFHITKEAGCFICKK